MSRRTRALVVGGVLAATVSGLPSTLWALLTGGDPLAAARAAGTLLPGRRDRPGLGAGVVAHTAVSAVWTAAFGLAARGRGLGAVRGAAMGLAIAAVDLEVAGRRVPAIAALPRLPQWADHLVFGAVLGHALRPHDVPVGRHRAPARR
jgi:hypothetical protein